MLQLLEYMFVTLGFACPLMSRNNSDHLKYVKMAGSLPPLCLCWFCPFSFSLLLGGVNGLWWTSWLPRLSPWCLLWYCVILCGSLDYCITIVAVLLLLLLIVYFRAAVRFCSALDLFEIYWWNVWCITSKKRVKRPDYDFVSDQPSDNWLYFAVDICCKRPIWITYLCLHFKFHH